MNRVHKDIQNLFAPVVDEFITAISETHDIPKEDLIALWPKTRTRRTKKKTASKSKNGPTGYVYFCHKITKGKTFADLNERNSFCSQEWAKRSDDEKVEWRQKAEKITASLKQCAFVPTKGINADIRCTSYVLGKDSDYCNHHRRNMENRQQKPTKKKGGKKETTTKKKSTPKTKKRTTSTKKPEKGKKKNKEESISDAEDSED